MGRDWILGHQLTFTLGGSQVPATDVTIDEDMGEVDATCLTSPIDAATGMLSYECANDVIKRTVSGTALLDRNQLAKFVKGSEVATNAAIQGDTTYDGKTRLSKVTRKGGARGLVQVTFSGTFTGSVAETDPA